MSKSYGQNCTLVFALDLLGERWTLLVIRELLPGPRRFSTLIDNLKGIGPNLLSARLKSLSENGIVERVQMPSCVRGEAWGLTAIGRELEPAVVHLAAWGHRHFPHFARADNHWSPMWNYVASRARFSEKTAERVTARGVFDIDGYVYSVVVDRGDFQFIEGQIPKRDFSVQCSSKEFREYINGKAGTTKFLTNSVEGNQKAFLACLGCFQ